MATTNDGNSILAIDDEYDIVNIIKLFLQNHGFKVSIFTDPYTALEHFVSNSQDYHIVISDIRMPSMNGYEFVKQVKGIKPQVKIILMTSFEIKDKEFSNVLPYVKIDAFIHKPFSLKTLRNIVQEQASN